MNIHNQQTLLPYMCVMHVVLVEQLYSEIF